VNILILGGGGREHALAWKVAQSAETGSLYIMPGNPGTAREGTNLAGSPTDFGRVKEVVVQHQIEMVIVGPEDPLVLGFHDYFLQDPDLQHVTVIGPAAEGARLEGSKDFAKEFMIRHQIPTAPYRSFSGDELEAAHEFLRTLKAPYVLKADGLAAGKGVVIHQDLDLAYREAEEILLQGKFGPAGNRLVIEAFLKGIEVSVFVLTDGLNYVLLPEAKDYKRIGEGDTGLNTGGMGTLSPVPFMTPALMQRIEREIVKPTIQGLISDGIGYTGFIFFGLMIVEGDPYVIEYNVRLGDPETESILPRIEGDLVALFRAVADQSLDQCQVSISPQHAATVMLVSGGYPGTYRKGDLINLPENTGSTLLFHAGTAMHDGQLVTSGGRVMGVTSLSPSLAGAFGNSFSIAEQIRYSGKYYRRDLGFDVL
jgi:phosphoribosylamine---glycine ligase